MPNPNSPNPGPPPPRPPSGSADPNSPDYNPERAKWIDENPGGTEAWQHWFQKEQEWIMGQLIQGKELGDIAGPWGEKYQNAKEKGATVFARYPPEEVARIRREAFSRAVQGGHFTFDPKTGKWFRGSGSTIEWYDDQGRPLNAAASKASGKALASGGSGLSDSLGNLLNAGNGYPSTPAGTTDEFGLEHYPNISLEDALVQSLQGLRKQSQIETRGMTGDLAHKEAQRDKAYTKQAYLDDLFGQVLGVKFLEGQRVQSTPGEGINGSTGGGTGSETGGDTGGTGGGDTGGHEGDTGDGNPPLLTDTHSLLSTNSLSGGGDLEYTGDGETGGVWLPGDTGDTGSSGGSGTSGGGSGGLGGDGTGGTGVWHPDGSQGDTGGVPTGRGYTLLEQGVDPNDDPSFGLLAANTRRIGADMNNQLRTLRDVLPMGGGAYEKGASDIIRQAYGGKTGLRQNLLGTGIDYVSNSAKEGLFGQPLSPNAGAASNVGSLANTGTANQNSYTLGQRELQQRNAGDRTKQWLDTFSSIGKLLGGA